MQWINNIITCIWTGDHDTNAHEKKRSPGNNVRKRRAEDTREERHKKVPRKQLEEELEFSQTVQQILVTEAAIHKEMISEMQDIFKRLVQDEPDFPHKVMGVLSRQTAHHVGMFSIHSLADQYIRNPDFDPYYIENGKEVLNEEDPLLVGLKSKYPPHVVEDVLRATRELKEYNPSGRYPVVVPWDIRKGKLTWSQVFKILVDQRRKHRVIDHV